MAGLRRSTSTLSSVGAGSEGPVPVKQLGEGIRRVTIHFAQRPSRRVVGLYEVVHRSYGALKLFWFVLATLMLAGAVTSFAGAMLADRSVAVPEAVALATAIRVPDSPLLCEDCGLIYEHLREFNRCEEVVCTNESYCDPDTGSCTAFPEPDGLIDPEEIVGCPTSTLPLRLVGTVVDEDGGWAHAVVHNTETGLTLIARPGDVLEAGHEVLDVERNRLRVITERGVDCLYSGSPGADEVRERSPPRRRASTEPLQNGADTDEAARENPPRAAEVLTEETTPDSDEPPPGTYRVSRSIVDAVANDPSSVGAASTRINPELDDLGETIGLRITGIGRSSALRQAGLRNGDVLVAVNGESVNSPQRGIAVYQRLSTSSSVSVEVLRRGERRRLRVEVTD